MKHLVLIIALVAFSTSAFAEEWFQNAVELRLVQGVHVDIEDRVKDGCLLSPDVLKVEAERILRRSGITIVSWRHYGPIHWLSIRAWAETKYEDGRATGACSISLLARLYSYYADPPHVESELVYMDGLLLTSAKAAQTQEALRAAVSEIVSDLANEILKAQGK